MKRCSRCKQQFPLDNFYNTKKNRDGKYSQCKQCSYQAVKKWRKTHHAQYNLVPYRRFHNLRHHAKRHNKDIIWEVTLTQFRELTAKPCIYCGGFLQTTPSPGLDRKDPNLGYLTDNVVQCCRRCNVVKNNVLTYEEMRWAMGLIIEYRRGTIDHLPR